jgi:membrane protein implicated in regulation of membrane protease activity
MTWANFYLVCFLIGFLFSLLSVLLGSMHVHLHLPHLGGHGLDIHFGHGTGHGAGQAGGHLAHAAGHAAHTGSPGSAAQEAAGGNVVQVSPFNIGTLAAFLAWFGGAGYIATRYSTFWSVVILGIAGLFGLFGAGIVFWFLLKLARHDKSLDPFDYEMAGVLGYVSSGIRAGGTGEIVYSQEGTRQTAGARSEDGSAIPKGTEIVVTRYENGIAYVRRWVEMAGEAQAAGSASDVK